STCPMLFITVVIFAWIASTVMASRSRTFAALTVRRSMNASLEVNRSNRAVSTLSQLDLMIFDVMISELTLRKSAYMASMDIALTLLVNKFVLTIFSIMAFSTNICLDLITFEPIISDVMTLDFKMAVCTRPKFASMASRERDVMWFDTMLDATISSARPVPNRILSEVTTFDLIMSDVM